MEKTGNFVNTWGATMCSIAENNPDVVIIDADLAKASGSYPFRDRFPERHFNTGIAEQDMVGVACGLADCGKIPFVVTFACFATQRACDQLVNGVAYNHLNVKVIGMGAGLTCTKNGGTHMGIIDLGIARSIPGFSVFDPSDVVEFDRILRYAASVPGAMYIRSNRGDLPVVHQDDFVFTPGKAEILSSGSDVTLITSGITTAEGIKATESLRSKGIRVDHLHLATIKPLDTESIVNSLKKTGKAVVCENHTVACGLGSAVCEALSEEYPVPVYRLGLKDCFGETASLSYLCAKYGIDSTAIESKILSIL